MYDFSQLSPIDFEELIRDLLAAEFGKHIEAFGPGKDQGIDARFSGKTGTTIIQAKHYIRSGRSALLSNLPAEVPKIIKLRPVRYVLVTSISLNPNWKNKILEALKGLPIAADDVLGQEDINALLRKHPEVEKAHFKLWLSSTSLLERIVHSEIYNRTDIELDLIEEMVPKFVQNASIGDAENILSKNGSLIISGHPGVGKTTLARMLAWLHAAQGWNVFVIDDIADAYKVPNRGSKRLVLFDDFLGQVRLSPDHVRGIDSKLPPFLHRAEKDTQLRFILTTRQYILSQASILSRRLADKSSTNKYVLNVGVYTRSIKARILYNHIYFSGLSDGHIEAILEEKFFLKIIDHPNFNPRLIEILTSESYAKLTRGAFRDSIERILDNPHELWEAPYREHIGDDGKVLMISLLLYPRSARIEELRTCFSRTAKAMGVEVPPSQAVYRFNAALKEIEGSALYILNDIVQFSNPGVRDYLQSVVVSDDLIPSLLAHAETFREVSQGWVLSEPLTTLRPPTQSDATRWIAALKSDRVAETTPILGGLRLCIQMYAYFGDDQFVALAVNQASNLECERPDPSESDELVEILRLIETVMPASDERATLNDAVTDSICELLENHAEEMSFDDVEALDDGLWTYADDTDRAFRATRAALQRIVDEIESGMEEYGSPEELDDFEERLSQLAKVRNFTGTIPEHKFLERRDYLEYKQSESYDDYERPSFNVSSMSPDSDAAIESMFENLSILKSES